MSVRRLIESLVAIAVASCITGCRTSHVRPAARPTPTPTTEASPFNPSSSNPQPSAQAEWTILADFESNDIQDRFAVESRGSDLVFLVSWYIVPRADGAANWARLALDHLADGDAIENIAFDAQGSGFCAGWHRVLNKPGRYAIEVSIQHPHRVKVLERRVYSPDLGDLSPIVVSDQCVQVAQKKADDLYARLNRVPTESEARRIAADEYQNQRLLEAQRLRQMMDRESPSADVRRMTFGGGSFGKYGGTVTEIQR